MRSDSSLSNVDGDTGSKKKTKTKESGAFLLVAEIDRRPTAAGTGRPKLHEVCVALELHVGGEEDVEALHDVVVNGNVHDGANLRLFTSRKQPKHRFS